MARIELRGVGKRFADGSVGVRDLTLTLEEGELLVCVGPSGSGKSTLLRLLAGLDAVSRGEIRFDGELVNDRSPQARNVAMVFQNYALYPHMTVRANLAFPLRMRRLRAREIAAQVGRVADLLGLTDLLDRKPAQLSGGQRQRVAMGRAIVREPALFLMDEPLSNLDARLRAEIRGEIGALVRQTGITTLYVTHDQVEAMTLGDRVAVLRDGALQQVGTPTELYQRPANCFVAGFLGTPGMNLFRTTLRRGEGGDIAFDFGDHRLPIDSRALATYADLDRHLGEPLIAGLRPEAFTIADSESTGPTIEARVTAVEPLGHETLVYFEAGVERVDSEGDGEESRPYPLAARVPGHIRMARGLPMNVGVTTTGLTLFDPNGVAIS